MMNFPAKKAYNPGGYSTFYFIPAGLIETYPMIIDGVTQVPVGLKPSVEWFIGYSTAETLVFSEEATDSPNGVFYTQTIAGFVPGDKPSLVALLQDLESQLFLVVLRDSLGKLRLVGSPGSPLKLTANFSSGVKRSDLKGFAFKFSTQILFRAPETTL